MNRGLPAGRTAWRKRPALPVVVGFAAIIVAGAVLLTTRTASATGRPTGFLDALFTATSAVCVTGLITLEPTHWSAFGQVVILVLIQLGGLGIMTAASVIGLLIFRRFGLRMRMTAQAETRSIGLGDVRTLVGRVISLSLGIELLVAAVLTIRLITGYGFPVGDAIYSGAFHAVSAFNNAGFSLYPDNLERFATDGWICLPIDVAIILGGLGFPVLLEFGRRALRRRRRWSLHAKLTLLGTGLLLVLGDLLITGFEWDNPRTLGPLGVPGKVLAGFTQSVMPRTAGFSVVDVGAMHPASLFVQDIGMFIGGSSAGTAGGIKVTTFVVLAFVIVAEARGEQTVHALGRQIPLTAQRQALTISLLGVGIIVAGSLALLFTTPFSFQSVLFEVISAFATVGLSTGITASLPAIGHIVLIAVMFVGRLGPVTLASALALRERTRRYERPEERPIVG